MIKGIGLLLVALLSFQLALSYDGVSSENLFSQKEKVAQKGSALVDNSYPDVAIRLLETENTEEDHSDHDHDHDDTGHDNSTESHSEEGHSEHSEHSDHYAILFPWFVQALGIVVFFLITRYVVVVPYTAVMFLIGALMGLGVDRRAGTADDQLTTSIGLWESIDAEVLLLVFLPGLIFRDAFTLNVHLFQLSFVQCLIMAFPAVLAGTCLVALVAFYIFPYGWSFNLAMTFGSILAATDPVAVSALLNEVGAPPRLKMHISGESLLNDGSAIVFFTIFSGLFLVELGIPGVGEEVDVAQGFAKFFQMSVAGALIGIVFAAALIGILMILNHRLNPEENVVQVTSTITTAYLCYYTSEVVCGCSGVIAVVFCGVTTRAFGSALINDPDLMESFWMLVEHLLNTLLFTLGGVVWGTIVSNSNGSFGAEDWGYLFILYLLLTAIRFVLMFSCYPIISHIGLKSSVKEMFFISYGGLRGAVGISLAVALESEVWSATTDSFFREQTSRLLGMVGGISLLTLFVNGMTAGPLLKKLGLAKVSEVREGILEEFHEHFKELMINDYITLLTSPVFSKVDYTVVKKHVSLLEDLSYEEFKKGVLKNKATVPSYLYKAPNLSNVLPYLIDKLEDKNVDLSWLSEIKPEEDPTVPHDHVPEMEVRQCLQRCNTPALQEAHGHTEEMKQLRLLFIEILRSSYKKLIERGKIDVRSGPPGFVAFTLEQGLEIASDRVNQGEPLHDWEATFRFKHGQGEPDSHDVEKNGEEMALEDEKKGVGTYHRVSTRRLHIDVNRAYGFIEAHNMARQKFRLEFCQTLEATSESEKLLLKESEKESNKAQAFLDAQDPVALQHIEGLLMCGVLLDKAVRHVEKTFNDGILSATEAGELIEHLDEEFVGLGINNGAKVEYPDEMTRDEKDELLGVEYAGEA